MDYDAVVSKLFERHRSVQSAGFSGDAYKPGLEAMADYSASLGDPQRRFRCIHVAGTNGKGSVCSMLAAALAACGLRVGLYTSPHLLDFRERIKIIRPAPAEGRYSRFAQHLISKEAVCEFLERYDREGLTFFEVTTGMAFWWFAQQNVDVAVIETGLGGRLDSTNIITPELSVITSIGLDHCDLLGSTRELIAGEKAGIFKSGVPALVWGRDPETQPVFERVAEATGSPLYFAEDFPLPPEARTGEYDLDGPCQEQNLRTVLAALDILYDFSLRTERVSENQPVAENGPGKRAQTVLRKHLSDNDLWNTVLEAVAHAGAITGLRGRWEILSRDPLVICDIGHNPPALAANFARLRTMMTQVVQTADHQERTPAQNATGGPLEGPPASPGPLLVVYGAMRDKDVAAISSLVPEDAEYFLVQPDTPRALPLPDLALKLKHLHHSCSGTVAQGVRDALDRARQIPGAIIYIGGSTYVVSEAISYLESL